MFVKWIGVEKDRQCSVVSASVSGRGKDSGMGARRFNPVCGKRAGWEVVSPLDSSLTPRGNSFLRKRRPP